MKAVLVILLSISSLAWADIDLESLRTRFHSVLSELPPDRPISEEEAAIATKLARSRIKAIMNAAKELVSVDDHHLLFIDAKVTERLAARRIVLRANHGAILRELGRLEREGIIQSPRISVIYANPGLDVSLRYFNKVKGQTVEVDFSIINRINDLTSIIEPVVGWRDLIVYGGPWDIIGEMPKEFDYESIWVQNVRFNVVAQRPEQ